MMSWLPENIATYGKELDDLFYLIYYITGGAFVLVTVLLVAFLVVYRERPGRRAVYTHGNTTLEMVWTIVPSLILVVLTFLSIPSWSKVKSRIPESDLHVRITGKQFNWEVHVPGAGREVRHRRRPVVRQRAARADGQAGGHAPARRGTSSTASSSRSCASSRTRCPVARSSSGSRRPSPASTRSRAPSCAASATPGMKGYLFVHTPEEYEQWLQGNMAFRRPAPPRQRPSREGGRDTMSAASATARGARRPRAPRPRASSARTSSRPITR